MTADILFYMLESARTLLLAATKCKEFSNTEIIRHDCTYFYEGSEEQVKGAGERIRKSKEMTETSI